MAAMEHELRINPVACSGHGLCAELLPELISSDEWGYPLVTGGRVPARLAKRARRAVADCPAMALLLAEAPGTFSANSEQAHRQGTARTQILRS